MFCTWCRDTQHNDIQHKILLIATHSIIKISIGLLYVIMLSVSNKPILLSVIMLSVVMLNVAGPFSLSLKSQYFIPQNLEPPIPPNFQNFLGSNNHPTFDSTTFFFKYSSMTSFGGLLVDFLNCYEIYPVNSLVVTINLRLILWCKNWLFLN